MPNDIIVAEGGGVAVVPRAKAEIVAKNAREIQTTGQAIRRKYHERAGRPRDFTMK